MKSFNSLPVGARFYKKKSDGTTNLRWLRIKVDTVDLIDEGNSSFKITEEARKNKDINCVILESTNGNEGYFDYVEPNSQVFVTATKYVC